MKNLYSCPYCDKKTNVISSLKRHIRRNHLTNEFYCPFCDKEFESIERLRYHIRTKRDRLHQRLYFLITKRIIKREDKEFLFSGD